MVIEPSILHIVFSILFLVFLFERGYFQAKAMRLSGEGESIRRDKRRLAVIGLGFLVGQVWVIGSLIYIFKPVVMEWTRLSIPVWVRWCGVAITLLGMALEFSTQLHLRENYSTTLHIQQDQSLITSGPYAYIRHPMYTALITVGIGMGVASSSWYFLLPFILTAIIIAFRTEREEEAMAAKFGDEYRRYIQSTGRFLPRLFRKNNK